MKIARLRIVKLPSEVLDHAVLYGSAWGVFMDGSHIATFDTWQECVDLVWSAQYPTKSIEGAQRKVFVVDWTIVGAAVAGVTISAILGVWWAIVVGLVILILSLRSLVLHKYLHNYFEFKRR